MNISLQVEVQREERIVKNVHCERYHEIYQIIINGCF